MIWARYYFGYGDERWCLYSPGNRMHAHLYGGIMRKHWGDQWLAYVVAPNGQQPSLGRFPRRGKARHAVVLAARSIVGST